MKYNDHIRGTHDVTAHNHQQYTSNLTFYNSTMTNE